ncbi:hypothetical protein CSUB01_01720 [Colletotrichum sublineola]|uniref:HNH nuclease domain-containing protein n=1 Tax=Colletotrichum sublineola TaxID=1173701 RepID=A0A066XDR4_COLSU|nr:hypothetical protein CSUB01_01720 [Colletotrichum sublineola]
MDPDDVTQPMVFSTVISHPLSRQQLDESQSELSSARSDPSAFADLEETCDRILELSPLDRQTLIILRSFRQMLPTHGQIALMSDIKTCGRNLGRLRRFAYYLVHTILKPMRLAGSVRSGSSAETPALDAAREIARLAALVQSSDRAQQSTLKTQCLKRDGFRCVYSHIADDQSAEDGLVATAVDEITTETNLSHILPLGLRKFDTANAVEREAVGKVWFGLYRYFPGLVGKIAPDTLNQHQNLVTLAASAHRAFDRHRLAFDPLFNQPTKYAIHRMAIHQILAQPPQGHEAVMTLVSSNHAFPLPEPEFFRVHYCIARILQSLRNRVTI